MNFASNEVENQSQKFCENQSLVMQTEPKVYQTLFDSNFELIIQISI
jgi:hypothetical protein